MADDSSSSEISDFKFEMASSPLALPSSETLETAIEKFLADPSFAEDTRRTYRSALLKFALFVEGKTFTTPRNAVVEFVRNLLGQSGEAGAAPLPSSHLKSQVSNLKSSAPPGLRPNTVHLYKAAVTSFLAHQGVVVGKIKGARRSRRFLKDALEPEEVRRMLEVWRVDSSSPLLKSEISNLKSAEGARNRAIIALLATTGLRQIEAWRADVEDLQTMEGTRILIVQGKGEDDKNNFVVIGDEAWAYLREWLKARETILGRNLKSQISNLKSGPSAPSPALFVTCGQRSFGKRMTRVALRWVLSESIRRAGLKETGKRISGHSLRHTFVTTYLQGGGNLLKAQEAARHADPATTQVYMDKLDRLKDPPEKAVSRAILKSS